MNVKGLFFFACLLAGSTSAQVTATSPLLAEAKMVGHLLQVTVTNTGSDTLLLADGCPRPFKVGFNDLSQKGRRGRGPEVTARAILCHTMLLPAQPWLAGTKRIMLLELDLPEGAHTLKPWADLQLHTPQGDLQAVRIYAPEIKVTRP